MMDWSTIILGILGLGWVGEIVVRLFKSNRRIENSKADNAEIEVAKNKAIAEAEAKKALEDAHAVQCHQYEERIADLHKTIDKLNEQLDGYVERDAAKEARFDEQTVKLREVQRKLLEETQIDIEYEKKIGDLEVKIEKIRCNRHKCPFRQPPNADTPAYDGRDANEYFKDDKQ